MTTFEIILAVEVGIVALDSLLNILRGTWRRP